MIQIEVPAGRGPYPVLVGPGALAELARRLAGRRVTVVSDATVGPLYAREVAAALGAAPPLELPVGEEHKRWPAVEAVCRRALADGLGRADMIVAVGGGVVTDIAGFAAAVYMRGVGWAAAPTTLLAMVDASVGGKTGVDLEEGKNLVGAFWPPRLVAADPDVLATLPVRQIAAGLAEVVKAAWIGDRGLLRELPAAPVPDALDPEGWARLVARAVRVKVDVVAADELEAGPRRALNLGHTVGHALEAASGYRLLHGEAVAWGMVAEARIARRRGILGAAAYRELLAAVRRLAPPPLGEIEPEAVLRFLHRDKKRDAGGVAWALPADHGVRLGERVSEREVLAALAGLEAELPR